MYLGAIVELAPAAELFGCTLHPYTKSLIAAVPRLEGGEKRERAVLRGETPNQAELIRGCPFAPRCAVVQDRCRDEAPRIKEVSAGHSVCCFMY